MKLLERFYSIIAPHDCLACGKEGSLLCQSCRSEEITPLPPRCYSCFRLSQGWRVCTACRKRGVTLHMVAVCTQYRGAAKELLYTLKFGRAVAAAETIAKCMVPLSEFLEPDCIITEVPTASSRVRQRGYDQSKRIAKAYAASIDRQYASLLWRMGNTRQVGQSRAARIEQSLAMFRIRNVESVKGRHVVIVDDVLTTGATIESAARCLKRSGAASVSAVLFAHRVQ